VGAVRGSAMASGRAVRESARRYNG